MSLVIHDLGREEWEKISGAYEGWTVISDRGTIHPCAGCFGCWNKTPGQCLIRDGYETMGSLIHQAEEVVVISRYTYGGFSGFVKNVFDRSLAYVLPQLTVTGGETHHKKRYREDKPFTFIFYGHNLSGQEKADARIYVRAVCTNIRGHVKEVLFRESEEPAVCAVRNVSARAGRVVLLNSSLRGGSSNSLKFAKRLAGRLKQEPEIIHLKDYMKDLSGLVRHLETAETIVFCVPLYVDGLPSQVIRLMERFRQEYRGKTARIYGLANMGLYESRQLENLFCALRGWCRAMGFAYGGSLGISAGELMGVLADVFRFRAGTLREADKGADRLAAAIEAGRKIKDLYAEPYLFPRRLYISIANISWRRSARKNGIRPGDLYCRI